MSDARKRTPQETLDAIRRMAAEDARAQADELDKIDSMNDGELERYLVAQGVDVAKVDAHARAVQEQAVAAIHALAGAREAMGPLVASAADQADDDGTFAARARRGQHPARGRVIPLRRPYALWLVAAAAAAVMLGGGAVVTRLWGTPPPVHTTPDQPYTPPPVPESPAPDARAAAAALRAQAKEACAAKQWTACLGKLDEARAKDLDGNGAADVVALRAQAEAALAADAKKPDEPKPPSPRPVDRPPVDGRPPEK
jgi:hypothetical protein